MMEILSKGCKEQFRVDGAHAGKSVECPSCGRVFRPVVADGSARPTEGEAVARLSPRGTRAGLWLPIAAGVLLILTLCLFPPWVRQVYLGDELMLRHDCGYHAVWSDPEQKHTGEELKYLSQRAEHVVDLVRLFVQVFATVAAVVGVVFSIRLVRSGDRRGLLFWVSGMILLVAMCLFPPWQGALPGGNEPRFLCFRPVWSPPITTTSTAYEDYGIRQALRGLRFNGEQIGDPVVSLHLSLLALQVLVVALPTGAIGYVLHRRARRVR